MHDQQAKTHPCGKLAAETGGGDRVLGAVDAADDAALAAAVVRPGIARARRHDDDWAGGARDERPRDAPEQRGTDRSTPTRADHEKLRTVLLDSSEQAVLRRTLDQADLVAAVEAQPHANGRYELLRLPHRLLGDVHEHEPGPQSVRQPTRRVGDRLGGVRLIRATDDRLRHRRAGWSTTVGYAHVTRDR